MEFDSISAATMTRAEALVEAVAARTVPDPVLADADEVRAARFVVEHEREAGRLDGESDRGAVTTAIGRMLSDYHPQEEDPTGKAAFALADLTMRREARGWLEAADRLSRGEPAGVEERMSWLIEDMVSDPDVRAAVSTSAEGLYETHDPSAQRDIRDDLQSGKGLDLPVLREWISVKDAEWGPVEAEASDSRRDRCVDAYEMAMREEARSMAEQMLGQGYQEYVAGEPGYQQLDDREQVLHSDLWFAEARRDMGLGEGREVDQRIRHDDPNVQGGESDRRMRSSAPIGSVGADASIPEPVEASAPSPRTGGLLAQAAAVSAPRTGSVSKGPQSLGDALAAAMARGSQRSR